jgi:hypothetical protein
MSGSRYSRSYSDNLCRIFADTIHARYYSSLERFEILVRSILMRQDHPAVLILGHFSPQVQREHGFASPDHWHNVVAQFYDLPHIRYDRFYPRGIAKEIIADSPRPVCFRFTSQHKADTVPCFHRGPGSC